MNIVIEQGATKRQIEESFNICASREHLRSMAAQILGQLDANGTSYGWVTILDHTPSRGVTGKPVEWETTLADATPFGVAPFNAAPPTPPRPAPHGGRRDPRISQKVRDALTVGDFVTAVLELSGKVGFSSRLDDGRHEFQLFVGQSRVVTGYGSAPLEAMRQAVRLLDEYGDQWPVDE